MKEPPGNSLRADQQSRVINPGSELVEGLISLLDRTRSEIEYNESKGTSTYRLGMHDGLRYAEDAIVALLEAYGHEPGSIKRRQDA